MWAIHTMKYYSTIKKGMKNSYMDESSKKYAKGEKPVQQATYSIISLI